VFHRTRNCSRACDELPTIYEELEETVDDAFDQRSFAPISRLFARAEAAEARYRKAVLVALAAQRSFVAE